MLLNIFAFRMTSIRLTKLRILHEIPRIQNGGWLRWDRILTHLSDVQLVDAARPRQGCVPFHKANNGY